MIFHNSEYHFFAALNNLGDMSVTLEGMSQAQQWRYDLDKVARVLRAFPACPVTMVPCSTWYRVPP
jgi:hypothetical protein